MILFRHTTPAARPADPPATPRAYDPLVPDEEITFPTDLITLQRAFLDLDAQVIALSAEGGDVTGLLRQQTAAAHALHAHPAYPSSSLGSGRVKTVAALRLAARAEMAADS